MKKSTKLAIITICATLAFICLAGYFGVREFVRAIYRQRDCEWANIDNIELHAEVNIPEINDSDCAYDPKQNIKRAFFIIDTQEVNLSQYVRDNGFSRYEVAACPNPAFFPFSKKSRLSPYSLDDLYCKQGSYDRESWKLLLDCSSGKLWVVLRYQDR